MDENKKTDFDNTKSDIKSNQTDRKQPLLKTFALVSGFTFLANSIYFFLWTGTSPFFIQFTNIEILFNIIRNLNPLTIPLDLLGSYAFLFPDLSFLWRNPAEGYYYYAEGVFPLSYIIIALLIYISGPFLCFLIAKQISKINPTDLSDSSTVRVLNYKDIIKRSTEIGFSNIYTILVTMILWSLTAWVPYLNVGTTIGLFGMIIAFSKNKQFSPANIFDARYRKNIGEFFLLLSFLSIGISIGSFFVFIPGVVIGIAWSQSILLLIDKDISPLEAIKISNDITYGEKLTMVIGYILLILVYGLIIGVAFAIPIALDSELFAWIILIVGYLIFSLILFGFASYIYSKLSKKL